jgi:predicted lipoprotein with Yx(FWY)xxD motif
VRRLLLAIVPLAVLTLTASKAGQAADSGAISAQKDLPYPAEVALIDEPSTWTYRANPTRLPLYFSDADPPGQSLCTGVCNWQWFPLFAPTDAKPVGDWSPISREDGKKQWAFKGHALYTHIHDTPDAAIGTGAAGWHAVPRFRQPANPSP